MNQSLTDTKSYNEREWHKVELHDGFEAVENHKVKELTIILMHLTTQSNIYQSRMIIRFTNEAHALCFNVYFWLLLKDFLTTSENFYFDSLSMRNWKEILSEYMYFILLCFRHSVLFLNSLQYFKAKLSI